MGFPRQEYWSGLPFPSPGDLPDPGTESRSPASAGGLFASEPPGYLIIIEKRRHGRAVRRVESRIPLSTNCKDLIINSVQRHLLFNHLISSSEAFSPTAATESTRKISSCITKLQECPINFHHVFGFGDHSKTTNIILSTGNQCHLPPLLAPSLVQLSLLSWLDILHQETSGKLITKTFEGRHEELPVLTKKAVVTHLRCTLTEKKVLSSQAEVGTR